MMEKTSKIERINVNCVNKIKQLDQLYDLLYNFKDEYGKYKNMTPTEKNIFNTLHELCDKEESNIVEAEKKVEEFFKDKLGKFLKMRIIVCYNGNEYTQEYAMYLYDFNENNKYFFAVMTHNIHGPICLYDIKDTSFSVDWFFRGDTIIETEEITKEEFVNIVTKGVSDILDYRLMRNQQNREKKDKDLLN